MKAAVILNKYFNTNDDPPGYQKKPIGEWSQELKQLSPDEKAELALAAAEDMGVELTV